MFISFLKRNLLNKKFFTFLLGSTSTFTLFNAKNNFDNLKKEFVKLKINEQNLNKNCKNEEIYNIEKENKNKKIINYERYNTPTENKFIFLIKNINLSLKQIYWYISIFNKKALCEVPKMKKPYLGCSIRSNEDGNYGMKILMIKSDSPAEKAGLKVKDIILEIDDKPISTINQYNAAVGLEAKSKKLKVKRVENGAEIILEIYVDFIYSE